MILDILSMFILSVRSIFYPTSLLLLIYPYCPQDALFSKQSFLLFSKRTHPLTVVPFVLDLLLFSFWTVPCSIYSTTLLVPNVEQQALTCISSLPCTLWSHSSFSLTVVPGQFTLFSQITVLSHSLWYQPAIRFLCIPTHCAIHSPCLVNPCDLP